MSDEIKPSDKVPMYPKFFVDELKAEIATLRKEHHSVFLAPMIKRIDRYEKALRQIAEAPCEVDPGKKRWCCWQGNIALEALKDANSESD